jgi:hypothetical protein
VAKQSGERYRESSVSALEERMHVLEGRVTALADVVRVLAHGLEHLPTAEPGQRPTAEAARRAYDLLLMAEPRTPAPQADSGEPDT